MGNWSRPRAHHRGRGRRKRALHAGRELPGTHDPLSPLGVERCQPPTSNSQRSAPTCAPPCTTIRYRPLRPAVQKPFRPCSGADIPADRLSPSRPPGRIRGGCHHQRVPFRSRAAGPGQTAQAVGSTCRPRWPRWRLQRDQGLPEPGDADGYWLGFLGRAAMADILAFPTPGGAPWSSTARPHQQAPAPGAPAQQLPGHSVSRILEAAGHQVVKVQVINDRGIHICKSMLAWQRFGNGERRKAAG